MITQGKRTKPAKADDGFRPAIVDLWCRLSTLAILGLTFVEALDLGSGKVLGWSFYSRSSEIIFEVAVRLIFTAVLGVALGTFCSLVLGPALWLFRTSRQQFLDRVTCVAVVLVLFLDSRIALAALIKWSYQISEHRGIIDTAIYGAFYIAFTLALIYAPARAILLSSLDGFLTAKVTRRLTLGTIASAVALLLFEVGLARVQAPTTVSASSQRPRSNILLITFDALSAEDTSLYGYKLPTTPHIDAFARTATVFKNYYSGSSFTTPSIATMMTGMYPSQTHVHHLHGELSEPEKTLPRVLRTGGYSTAGFFSNPAAFYLAQAVRGEFDFLPEPVYLRGGFEYIWNATALLHPPVTFGNRADEHQDLVLAWSAATRMPTNSLELYPASMTFENARQLLDQLPDGFFLWIHVMTPHAPYSPRPQERGRFLRADAQQFFSGKNEPNWTPNYPPDQQSKVDEYRLRYDEFIITADREFGSFISDLEARGKLQKTNVIVSADHGESFEGGMYQHGGPYLTRPVIHVPLIIKTVGQQEGREANVAADETALAPTIVELAGLKPPVWMRGQSLARWLNGGGTSEEGLAFTQYFEKNSVFQPLQHGSVGVIDGRFQYLFDLDTGKGKLRPLDEAQVWNLDRSAQDPVRAATLRAAIYSRFPELKRESE